MTPESSVNDEGQGTHATVWPHDVNNLDDILALLKDYEGRYEIVKSKTTGRTTCIGVENLDTFTIDKLQRSPSVNLAYYTESFHRHYPVPEKIGIILTDESATRMPGPAITVEEFLNEEGAGTNASIWPRNGKITEEIMSLIKDYEGRYHILGSMESCSFIIVENLNVDTIVKLQKCPDVGMAYYMSAMLRKFPDPGDPVAPL